MGLFGPQTRWPRPSFLSTAGHLSVMNPSPFHHGGGFGHSHELHKDSETQGNCSVPTWWPELPTTIRLCPCGEPPHLPCDAGAKASTPPKGKNCQLRAQNNPCAFCVEPPVITVYLAPAFLNPSPLLHLLLERAGLTKQCGMPPGGVRTTKGKHSLDACGAIPLASPSHKV